MFRVEGCELMCSMEVGVELRMEVGVELRMEWSGDFISIGIHCRQWYDTRNYDLDEP